MLVPAGKGRRRARGLTLRRGAAIGALVLVALLYYRPLRAYLDARSQRAAREHVVRRLQDERATLERRVAASSSLDVLAREARALGFVRKGEHLFVVRGISDWRKRHHAGKAARSGR